MPHPLVTRSDASLEILTALLDDVARAMKAGTLSADEATDIRNRLRAAGVKVDRLAGILEGYRAD